MKKVIRLTESDLTRIVKRVLNEEPTKVIKVKVFGGSDDQKKGYPRSCNIDVKNIKLYGAQVRFDYTVPGGGNCSIINSVESTSGFITSTGKGLIECGVTFRNPMIYFLNQTTLDDKNGVITGALSKEGYAKLSYLCNEYASVEDDDMDNNYA